MDSARLVDRPIIVIGCNRSGTTVLFMTLAEHPVTWSRYEESQKAYYRHFPRHPDLGDRVGHAAPPGAAADIADTLFREAHNKEILCDHRGLDWIPRRLLHPSLNGLYKQPPIRLVEKTPANSLRVPLLAALFPDARFVFVVRRAEDVISSLMEGWKRWSGTAPGRAWAYSDWHYLAPPGWRDWTGRSLPEICAFQWVEGTRTAWDDLERLCPGRYLLVRHEDALKAPRPTYQAIREFCQLPPSRFYDRRVATIAEREFTHGGSPPRVDKWRELNEGEVESVRHQFQPLMKRLYPESGT